MNVSEVLERFRMAEYHYPDVIWHDIRSVKLKPKLTTELANLTAEQFKELLLSKLFLPKSISKETAKTIVSENDFNLVKLRLLDLFVGVSDFKQSLQAVLDIKGFDACIASQLLAAINNQDYTIYHEHVVNGIRLNRELSANGLRWKSPVIIRH